MNENIISVLSDPTLLRAFITWFGVFLFVWLFKLGLNSIVRWFNNI